MVCVLVIKLVKRIASNKDNYLLFIEVTSNLFIPTDILIHVENLVYISDHQAHIIGKKNYTKLNFQ